MEYPEKVHESIAFADTIKTRTGLPNNPDAVQLKHIIYTAKMLMIVILAIIGKFGKSTQYKWDSWFRCKAVNKKVKGAKNSTHMTGYAVDLIIYAKGVLPINVVAFIYFTLYKTGIIGHLKELIVEPTWVHIAFSEVAVPEFVPRKKVTINGEVHYPQITEKDLAKYLLK